MSDPVQPTLPPTLSVSWTDPAREAAFGRWMAEVAPPHGLRPETLRLASADASFRRYLRVDTPSGTLIIMDAPPANEDCKPFVKVAQLMAQAGLHVPRVLAWDEPLG